MLDFMHYERFFLGKRRLFDRRNSLKLFNEFIGSLIRERLEV